MSVRRDLATAGFLVTAVTYGPARMGFGLHLPELRQTFDLTSTSAGLISAGLFAAFLAGAIAASWLDAALGPRAPILVGCVLAAVGLTTVALAGGVTTLSMGVVLAGAGPGLCWSPFNDAAAQSLPEEARGTPLSLVSTGTTVGVSVAGATGVLVVLTGLSWRWAWAAYAVAGVGAAVVVLARLSPGGRRDGEAGVRPRAVRALGWPLAWPVATAATFGLTSSVYIAFAADLVAATDGLPAVSRPAAPGVLFVVYGLGGLVGLATAVWERLLGFRTVLAAVFTASALSLSLLAGLPGWWPSVVASAALQGVAVMTVSALLSFWTARLYPESATTAFTVVVIALASGSVVGPALAGLMLEPLGPATVFGGAAALGAVTGAALVLARPPAGRVGLEPAT